MEISNATTAENDVAMKMRSNNPYAQRNRNATLEHRVHRECPNGGKQDTTVSASHIHTPSRQPPVQLPPDMDDDAMINEYMDYDNEEPPDYIDHELEDYENFVQVNSNKDTVAQNGLPEMNIRNSTTNTIINNMNTVQQQQQQRDTSTVPQRTVAIFREEDSDDEMITATSAGRSRVVNGPKRDLYKFERLEFLQYVFQEIWFLFPYSVIFFSALSAMLGILSTVNGEPKKYIPRCEPKSGKATQRTTARRSGIAWMMTMKFNYLL
jgi:hypothetical protein